MNDLVIIAITKHVICENDEAQPREHDATQRDRAKLLMIHAPLLPMAMRTQNARRRAFQFRRQIQIACADQTGHRFNPNFLDDNAPVVRVIPYICLQLRHFRHRRQSCRQRQLAPRKVALLFPFLQRIRRRRTPCKFVMADGQQPLIHPVRLFRQYVRHLFVHMRFSFQKRRRDARVISVFTSPRIP